MQELYLIVYAAGVIGGTFGPLPYDMNHCIANRDMLRAEQSEGLANGTNVQTGQPLTPTDRAGIESLSFECEFRTERPELGSN